MPHDDDDEDDRCLQQHVMVMPNITSHMPTGVGGFVFAVFLRTIIFGRERRGPGPGNGKAAGSHIASAEAITKAKHSNPAVAEAIIDVSSVPCRGRGRWGRVRGASKVEVPLLQRRAGCGQRFAQIPIAAKLQGKAFAGGMVNLSSDLFVVPVAWQTWNVQSRAAELSQAPRSSHLGKVACPRICVATHISGSSSSSSRCGSSSGSSSNSVVVWVA